MTGKWRIQTTGVNLPVLIAGGAVQPGDLVLADEAGVCFVPFAPSPVRYGLHKLLVYGERTEAFRIKSAKDLLPSTALLSPLPKAKRGVTKNTRSRGLLSKLV